MKKGEPISPDEIAEAKVSVIPSEVFDAFNGLIASNYTNGRARFEKDEVINHILVKKMDTSRNEIISSGWLNVEEAYRAKGWKVSYVSPDYTESFPAYFEFKKYR